MGELLDLSFNLYFRNFLAFARTAAVVIVPFAAISLVLLLIALSADPADDPGFLEYGDNRAAINYGAYITAVVIGGIMQGLAFLVVIGAVMKSVADAYRGREVSAGGSLKAGLRRLPSLLWISLLVVLGIGLLTLISVFFFPAFFAVLYMYVAWSLAVPVLMVEGVKGTKALGRSMNLIDKSWWRSFGVYVVGFLVYGAAYVGAILLGEAIGGSIDDAKAYEVVSALILTTLQVIATPFVATLIGVVYFDNRVRKEGLDIEAMAGELEDEGPRSGNSVPAPAGAALPEAPKDA